MERTIAVCRERGPSLLCPSYLLRYATQVKTVRRTRTYVIKEKCKRVYVKRDIIVYRDSGLLPKCILNDSISRSMLSFFYKIKITVVCLCVYRMVSNEDTRHSSFFRFVSKDVSKYVSKLWWFFNLGVPILSRRKNLWCLPMAFLVFLVSKFYVV